MIGSCCSTGRKIKCYQQPEDDSNKNESIKSSSNSSAWKLMDCPEGKDACLTIEWSLPTIRGCAELGDFEISKKNMWTGNSVYEFDPLGVKKANQKRRINIDRVCFTDVSEKINREIKKHLKMDDNFQLYNICACTWDGCNAGTRKEIDLIPIVIFQLFILKLLSE